MVASGPTVGLVGAVAVALGFAAGHWTAKRRRATKGVRLCPYSHGDHPEILDRVSGPVI